MGYFQAIEEYPSSHALYTNRALANSRLSRWEVTVRDARRAIDLCGELASEGTFLKAVVKASHKIAWCVAACNQRFIALT